MGGAFDPVPTSALDYRRLAERRLPRFLFDYLDGGANDELTLARNVADFQAIRLRQRVMRDVSSVDASTTLAGEHVAMPLVLAPIGLAGMMARRGECQAARAASAAGVPFTLSTVGICGLEEVRAAASGAVWFQLYMMRDRGAVKALLERAAGLGCGVLVFTVDLPVTGARRRDVRNGMLADGGRAALSRALQIGSRPRWVYDVGLKGKPHGFGNLADRVADPTDLKAFRAWIDAQFDPSVTWKDIAWLRDIWKGKLIVKGVLEAEDAKCAADLGADGLVVSNHGGRQLDSVSSPISKLPAVAATVGDRLEVYVDGGVRGGVDIVKALALGARGVMIGRPWIWALAGAGEIGLADYLASVKRELEVAMALCGVTRVEHIRSEHIDTAE